MGQRTACRGCGQQGCPRCRRRTFRPAGVECQATLRRTEPHAAERTQYERLTDREREVLRLVAGGYSAPEIGEQLLISPKTVDTYKQRINEKLGLAHRSDYVDFALKIGLLNE